MKRDVKQFKKEVWNFYKKAGRRLPWRETKDPYHILVSEIMLQQTGVNRVLPKYEEFLQSFPTVRALANAPLTEVLGIWIGLGYNRRAKFLWQAAKVITETVGETFPRTMNELVKLPGVGTSTAGALLNFSFETAHPFIETNIRTVYIHHFWKNAKTKVSDKDILALVEETLDRKNPREWFYALYDYGTHLKKTLHRDPAQKSRHYKKQSTFKGSFREKRAFILKLLIKEKVGQKNLKKLFAEKFKSEDFSEVLTSLKKDSLV